MEALRIQADAIIVSPAEILRPGQLTLRNGKIESVTGDCSKPPDVDLPGWQLSAGLINVHTHLEFSDLPQPIASGPTFPDWIARVVQHRRSLAADLTPEAWQARVAAARWSGLCESWSTGTVLLADIVTRPWHPSDYRTVGATHLLPAVGATHLSDRRGAADGQWQQHLVWRPQVLALPEILGLMPVQLQQSIDWAVSVNNSKSSEAEPEPSDPLLDIGFSPHAPYSLEFESTCQSLEPFRLRPSSLKVVAMHVAESLEERQWLESASGPFRTAFERLGVPLDSPRTQISKIVEWLCTWTHSLLIHGNYLTPGERALLAGTESTTVVYCPRTHHHFRHSSYPLVDLLASKIPVVLATDSRASSPDLDLWEEARLVRRQFPEIAIPWIFAAVTESAARALGLGHHFGSLRPGRRAAINASRHDAGLPTSRLLDNLLSRERPFQPLSSLLHSRHEHR